MSFGNQDTVQQPMHRLTWQEYLDRIKNGPAPTYTPPANAQQPQGPGTAAGWIGGGGTVTNIMPPTPVDYGRMHSILNSGVLTGGYAQTANQIPAPAPVNLSPPPVPAQQQSPFQAFLTSLMNGAK
jgi:hypothetical protein